jgi:cell division cycle 20-like protein 1 (cofactor of APC complex)
LRSEIFDTTIPQATPPTLSPDPTLPPSGAAGGRRDPYRARTPPAHDYAAHHALSSASASRAGGAPATPARKNLFTYMSPRQQALLSGHLTPAASRTPQHHAHQRHAGFNARSELYSLSPVRLDSQRLLLAPRRAPRPVSRVPFKVLDAPDLADDFYLNLVDWGSANLLGVGLGNCVYMWNAQSGRVTQLCKLKDDMVTSVSWIQRVCSIFSPSPFFFFSKKKIIFYLPSVKKRKEKRRTNSQTLLFTRARTSPSAHTRASCKSGTLSVAAACAP